MHDSWSLGTIVWLPICFILVVLCVVAALLLRYAVRNEVFDRYDRGPATFIKWCFFVVAAVLVVATTVGMFPYKTDYHKYKVKDGTVQTIDKRLVSSGNSMEEKFVVTFNGNPQQYGCTDTRCATIKTGDYLALKCKKVFEWAATDGFDCRYQGYKSKP